MATHCFAPRRGVRPVRGPGVAVVLAAVFLSIAAVGGPRGSAAAQTVPPARRLDTLAAVLPLVRRTDGQPPLLVVDAANTRPTHERMVSVAVMSGSEASSSTSPPPQSSPPPVLVPGRDGTLALRDVAAFFHRRVALAGSVSVLAPTTMVVLNTRPGKPDLSASPEANDRLQLLLASLSPAQWRLLGGERGLGAGDLNLPAQRDLFLSLLPDPFRLHRSVVGDGPEGQRPARPDGDPVTLSPGQRAAVRLVLLRQAVLFVPQPDRPRYFWNFRLDRRYPEGASYLQIEPFPGVFRTNRSRTEAYGVTLRDEVAGRAKPGGLAFDAARLDPPVALNGAKTVDDLVKRAGSATGLELYADARLAALPVTVLRGGGDDENLSVRAGDVLRALALAVTGAFRTISANGETAYVLTDDVEGIGTRQARLEAWRSVADARAAGQRRALLARIARQRPATQELAFAPDDSYALPAGLVRKMEDAGAKSRLGDLGTAVNVSELPPAFQQIVRAAAAGNVQGAGTAYNETAGRTGTGQVGVAVRTTIACVIPGKGVVTGLPGVYGDVNRLLTPFPFGPPTPPASPKDALPVNLSGLPAPLATRALLARLPASAGEAAALVREAGRRGLNQVWLALPDAQSAAETETRTILNAAIAAGTSAAQKISVVVLTPVLREREPENNEPAGPEDDDLDRNVLGETRGQEARRLAAAPGPPGAYPNAGDPDVERRRRERLLGTGDLLRVDRPDVTARLARHLSDLAALPGLSGLVLEQSAAPGYDMPAAEAERWGNLTASGFGYTPSMRLAFLRQTGVDAVDLSVAAGNRSPNGLDLPFFPALSSMILHLVNGKPVVNEEDTKAKNRVAAWLAFRYEVNRRFLADLHAAIGRSNPGLPLLLAERGGAPWFRGGGVEDPLWYSFWERPDALPRFSYFEGAGGVMPSPARQARAFSSRNLARLGPWPGRDRFPEWLPKNLPELAKDWNGFVFDLREMPAADALALLQTAFAPSGDGK